MERHFKLTANKKVNAFGVTLFQVELTIDCKWGKKEEKGGWIESCDHIENDAQVYGNAQVYGDAWEKSPLQIQGTKHFICTPRKGHLKIGCMDFTLEYWQENFKKIGRDNSYTDLQINEYYLYIMLAVELFKHLPK